MSLFEQITADRIQAMRDKEDQKKTLLATLKGELDKNLKVLDGKKLDPTDEEVIALIKKFIKNAEETLKLAEAGKTPILPIANEIEILSAYLPKQLTEAEIRQAVLDIKAQFCGEERTATMKDVMQVFKNDFAGQYDGGLVSKIAKEML